MTARSAAERIPSRTDAERIAAIETASRHYARLAAELVGARLAAVRIERDGTLVVYETESFEPGRGYDGARSLAGTISSQLWFARSPLAIPDVQTALPLFGRQGAPAEIGGWLAAPLIGERGRFLGSLCVADYEARHWTAEETDRLGTLAASLGHELDAGGHLPARAPSLALVEDPAPAVDELHTVREELLATRSVLEGEREHYRELFECLPYPCLITERDGTVREANRAAETLLGTKGKTLVGSPLADFIPEAGRGAFRTKLSSIRGGDRTEWAFEIAPRGSAPRRVQCAASPTRGPESDGKHIYWILHEVEGGTEPAETDGEPAPRGEAFDELVSHAALRPGVPILEQLRELIANSLHTGSLQVGQRLPSIRAIADRFGVTSYAALQAYASLEAEGIVERRERSGVYVSSVDWSGPAQLPETAEWLAGVLTQACQHQLRIPQLPDLVRRWTATVEVRCACVESCADTAASLCQDLTSRFGVQAVPVTVSEVLNAEGSPRRTSALPARIQEAHLLVTTPFHASRMRPIAQAAGKPLLVATMNEEIVAAVEAHLAANDLTVVCVDRTAGERIRGLRGGAYRSRVKVVLADELEGAQLDRSEPVFLTQAARQRLKGASLRLVAPPTPAFSLEFARKVSGTLVRLNVDGGRG